jgi:hypothetical protein
MSGNPFLRFTRDREEGLKVTETERGAVAPGARLIFEWLSHEKRRANEHFQEEMHCTGRRWRAREDESSGSDNLVGAIGAPYRC